nr:MAG TPA: hypothetical protein [Caudoviricetes sp.]
MRKRGLKHFLVLQKQWQKYRDYIPHYDSWIWTATPWGCGDKDSDAGGSSIVRTVNAGGLLYDYGACNCGAIAPACVLNPKSLNLRKIVAYVEEISE